MRQIAPAFVLTTIVALASASSLAMDDLKKNANASNPPAATQSSSKSTTTSGSAYSAPVSNAAGTPPTATGQTDNSSSTSLNAPTPAGDTGTRSTKTKKSQTAKNDDRCDESKHPGMTLPKECSTKSGTGAAATFDTQGQSGASSSGGDGSSSK